MKIPFINRKPEPMPEPVEERVEPVEERLEPTEFRSYSDLHAEYFTRFVNGKLDITESTATATYVFALGLLSRAFMAGRAEPALAALSPDYMANLMIDLMETGNHVAAIDTQEGEIALLRATSYDLQGGHRPDSWHYNIELSSPSRGSEKVQLPYAGVIHVRLNPPRNRPWQGQSALSMAATTSSLAGRLEQSLSEQERALIANILTIPSGQTDAQKNNLAAGLIKAEGKPQLMETSRSAGWRNPGASGDVGQVRLGPEPNANEVALRPGVSQDLLSAMGIPGGLYAPKEGTVSREAYRQLLVSTIMPYANLIAYEMSQKLEIPIRFTFDDLAAADVRQRVGAVVSLVQANASIDDGEKFTMDEIRRIAGIS